MRRGEMCPPRLKKRSEEGLYFLHKKYLEFVSFCVKMEHFSAFLTPV